MTSSFKRIDYLAVINLKQGDVKAFDESYSKYSQKQYNFSIKYLKSTEEDKELV